MKKNILIGFLIAASIAVYFISTKRKDVQAENLLHKIDSIQAVLDTQDTKVIKYKDEVKELNTSQDIHIQRADSLQNLLNEPMPCPDKVHLLTEQVVELREGLEKCIESKAIQTKIIGVQGSQIINVIEISNIKDLQIQNCEEQIKRKKIWVWVERVGWVGLLLLVAL